MTDHTEMLYRFEYEDIEEYTRELYAETAYELMRSREIAEGPVAEAFLSGKLAVLAHLIDTYDAEVEDA